MKSKQDPEYIKEFKNNCREKRLAEVHFIKDNYNDKRVPIIVDTFETKLNLKKHKYLVPKDLIMSNFFSFLRKKILLDKKDAIFILCNNKLVNMNSTLGEIYNTEKDNDNFLYFILTIENAFG